MTALTKTPPQLTPEVAPEDDLGKAGSVIVRQNSSIETTVTFFIPEALSDQNDNRRVSYR